MLFALLSIAVVLLVYLLRHVYTHWRRKGFPYEEPDIPFGCLKSVSKREQSLGMAIYDVYKARAEKYVGIYLMFRPALLIRDAVMARDILVKDFPSFHDRGIYVDEERDPFSGTLFALQGQKWKTLRTKLTPFFTSGKLRGMMPTFLEVADRMETHLNEILPPDGSSVVEMKSILTTYAIDIIGSVVFGLDIDSFKDPHTEFREVSRDFQKPTLTTTVRVTAQLLCPVLEKLFVFLGMKQEPVERMKRIVRQTVEYREAHNIVRRDIMQLLIQLRNTGKVNADDDIWDVETAADGLKAMSIESIAGQAFLFYVAGYETSASTAAFTIFELAQNPSVLAKAQEDVAAALEKHGGKLTYEALKDMTYLDLCFMETIRKYPGLPILNRECTQDYPVPGTDHVITKGTPIVISLFGIHRDAQYFPDPLKYDPERFLPSNQNYDPTAYMPFGEGPRHCIAQRMGKIVVKVALVKILTNYNFEATQTDEIEFDVFSATIIPKGGINVKLSRRKPTFPL